MAEKQQAYYKNPKVKRERMTKQYRRAHSCTGSPSSIEILQKINKECIQYLFDESDKSISMRPCLAEMIFNYEVYMKHK
jgi:hypothetical protein